MKWNRVNIRVCMACAFAVLTTGCSVPAIKAPDRVFTEEMEEQVRAAYLQKFDGLLKGTPSSRATSAPGRQPAPRSGVRASGQTSINATGSSADAKAFLKMGMRIADQRCARYFDALGQAVRQFNFGRKEMGLAAAFTAAVQGLTGVAAKDIALTAGAFGFGAASLDNFGDAFLFSPDIHAIRGLVQRAHDSYESALSTENVDLMDAAKFLKGYESLCTVDGIRSLVNSAVESERPVAFTIPPSSPPESPTTTPAPAPSVGGQVVPSPGIPRPTTPGATAPPRTADPQSKSPPIPQLIPSIR